jgi:TRAP-type C4-dicarboxylate transport system substrate-binding protein
MRPLAQCCAVLVLLGGLGHLAHAQTKGKAKYHIKFETIAIKDTPWSMMFERFLRHIRKGGKGRIDAKGVFGSPAGENDIVRRCIDGSVQSCGVTVGALATVVKDLSVLELPFLFLDFDEADSILEGPALPLVKKILARHGLVFYSWAENGWRSFGTKTKPILVPKDLKGLKMRAQENPISVELHRALKAVPVPLNTPDVAAALQEGRVDGFDQSPIYMTAASWEKQIKYFTLTRHMYQPCIVAFNKKFFDGLPKDLQRMILASSADVASYGRREIRKVYEPILKNLEEQKIQVIRLTPARRIPFIMATKPVHVRVYKKASARAKKLLDTIYKAKEKKGQKGR